MGFDFEPKGPLFVLVKKYTGGALISKNAMFEFCL